MIEEYRRLLLSAALSFFFGCSILFPLCGCDRRGNAKTVSCRNAPSPHFDRRPAKTAIDTIVLHATERPTLAEVIRVFQSPLFPVSSHFTIGKSGEVVCHVPLKMRAWHAGESQLPHGRKNVNHFSVGIELVNRNDGQDLYPEPQLQALRSLLSGLCTRYKISWLVGHGAIALPAGRKSDPRGFPVASLEGVCAGAERAF